MEVPGPRHQLLQCAEPILSCCGSFWTGTDTACGTQSPNAPLTIICIFGNCTFLLTKATYSPCDDDDQVTFSKPRTCKSPSKFSSLWSHTGGIEVYSRLRLLMGDRCFISSCGCSFLPSQIQDTSQPALRSDYRFLLKWWGKKPFPFTRAEVMTPWAILHLAYLSPTDANGACEA